MGVDAAQAPDSAHMRRADITSAPILSEQAKPSNRPSIVMRISRCGSTAIHYPANSCALTNPVD
jgi:hypothetical protein